jgi:glycosyltransferase involved in cell wall biosynthesis
MTPKISVLLPAFNAQAYLRESIESILAQTFEDFELLIINDGSTDQSLEIMSSFGDPRIRIINQANAGLPVSLNIAIKQSQGTYLARQDADDISLPNRLAEQVQYLDANPECALLGSWADIILENSPTDRYLRHPHSNGDIQIKLFFFNCFVHSSVMIRKSALDQCGLYPEEKEKFPPEDYDLWLRIAKDFEVANLPQTLLLYRELPNSISRTKLEIMQDRARLMSLNAIKEVLNPPFDEDNIRTLIRAMTNEPFTASQATQAIHLLMLEQIRDSKLAHFPQSALSIQKGFDDSQALLIRAYQKLIAKRFVKFLPFDIIPLLKKIKNTCLR